MSVNTARSRQDALVRIREILTYGKVDEQFATNSSDYYSNNKFIVTWFGKWQGMLMEYSIDKTDNTYSDMTGSKAIYVRRSLIYEKQLSAHPSIEHALISAGLKLCSNKEEKKRFFEDFAKPYNIRVQALKIEKEETPART